VHRIILIVLKNSVDTSWIRLYISGERSITGRYLQRSCSGS